MEHEAIISFKDRLSAGFLHSMVIDDAGVIYTWGGNAYGQLGNTREKKTSIARPILSLPKVIMVAAGYYHSMCLCENGHIYLWGRNKDASLGLGHNRFEVYSPEMLPTLDDVDVASIAAGRLCSFAISHSGHVYSWGDNTFKVLGHSFGNYGVETTPKRVVSLPPISKIQSQHGQTVALSKSRHVFTWGSAIEGTEDGIIAVSIENVIDIALGSVCISSPHILCVLENGKVVAWGSNDFGQLGIGHCDQTKGVFVVSGLKNIKSVSAGLNMSFAVDNEGQLYRWGHFSESLNTSKEKRPSPSIVVGVNCHHHCIRYLHSVAVLFDGTLRTWGWNEHDQSSPQKLRFNLRESQSISKVRFGLNAETLEDATLEEEDEEDEEESTFGEEPTKSIETPKWLGPTLDYSQFYGGHGNSIDDSDVDDAIGSIEEFVGEEDSDFIELSTQDPQEVSEAHVPSENTRDHEEGDGNENGELRVPVVAKGSGSLDSVVIASLELDAFFHKNPSLIKPSEGVSTTRETKAGSFALFPSTQQENINMSWAAMLIEQGIAPKRAHELGSLMDEAGVTIQDIDAELMVELGLTGTERLKVVKARRKYAKD